MRQEGENIDIGLPLGFFGQVPFTIHGKGARSLEDDVGKLLLPPALQIRRRLHLDFQAGRRHEIISRPFRPALPQVAPKRHGHDIFSQHTAGGVIDDVGEIPAPEVGEVLRERGAVVEEGLGAGEGEDG